MFSLRSLLPIVNKIYTDTVRTIVTCNRNPGTKSLLSSCKASVDNMASEMKPNSVWSFDSVRTNVRNTFPYPKETKRVKTHGWKVRMSTASGRKVIMRRILKGRHVLSH